MRTCILVRACVCGCRRGRRRGCAHTYLRDDCMLAVYGLRRIARAYHCDGPSTLQRIVCNGSSYLERIGGVDGIVDACQRSNEERTIHSNPVAGIADLASIAASIMAANNVGVGGL